MTGRLKYVFSLVFLMAAASGAMRAQNVTEQVIYDSTYTYVAPLVDSSLVGKDMFSVVEVRQSDAVRSAFENYKEGNRERKITGYRVRIFFDNSQEARVRSEAVAREFAAEHPDVKVYRSHISPYFKVTVGDFRSRIEAMAFAKTISDKYPSVFLVKENIHYPEI
ncbi:MAG: SPOR domain-containing protein [Bacteroidales bacterium]|nr:SPOR domain-containing protein [Candidatus Cacconaster scatequi]